MHIRKIRLKTNFTIWVEILEKKSETPYSLHSDYSSSAFSVNIFKRVVNNMAMS